MIRRIRHRKLPLESKYIDEPEAEDVFDEVVAEEEVEEEAAAAAATAASRMPPWLGGAFTSESAKRKYCVLKQQHF